MKVYSGDRTLVRIVLVRGGRVEVDAKRGLTVRQLRKISKYLNDEADRMEKEGRTWLWSSCSVFGDRLKRLSG